MAESLRQIVIALVFLAVGVATVSGCYHAGFEAGVKAGVEYGYDEAARHYRQQGLVPDTDSATVAARAERALEASE